MMGIVPPPGAARKPVRRVIYCDMADASAKTNAIRLLERTGVPFDVLAYDVGDAHLDAVSVAGKTGVEPERVFKTLVTRTVAREVIVFVVPGPNALDLKKAAREVGAKVEMLPVAELFAVTGYVRGGCSPFAMKKPYTTILDESAAMFDRILVSAGRPGLQLEIEPQVVIRHAGARYADVV